MNPNTPASDRDLQRTLRALGRLLQYPDAALRANLADLRSALHGARCVGRDRLAQLDDLIAGLQQRDGLVVEAEHVQWFDSGRATSLHLFEHVHGDSRDRGPAMIDLAKTYASEGLYVSDAELPDHLPVVVEFASVLDPRRARSFLAEMAEILNTLHAGMVRRGSPHACVVEALLDIAGERVHAVAVPPDAPVDSTWSEPVVFDGCSTAGQSRPDGTQPIRFFPHSPASGAHP